jgi:hypothetical protein
MGPVITNQFEVSLDGLASVRALHTRSRFHHLARVNSASRREIEEKVCIAEKSIPKRSEL